LLPVNLQVTATTSLAGLGTVGDEVNMSRTIEVALIPVFQFGVFSNSDLGFFSSPNLNFAGRVHTNGDLYLGVATGSTLTFHDKLTAWGNVIRTVLPNGLAANAFNDSGTVLIPQSSGGCDLPAQPACRAMKSTEGSITGAGAIRLSRGRLSVRHPGKPFLWVQPTTTLLSKMAIMETPFWAREPRT
jgi:hypothetical protein